MFPIDIIELYLHKVPMVFVMLLKQVVEHLYVSMEREAQIAYTSRRYQILPDKGRVSHRVALEKASQEYDIFNRTQKLTSDFDREIAKLTAGQKGEQ